MKKLAILIAVVALLITAVPAFAAKGGKNASCTFIQDGDLTYSTGHYFKEEPLMIGYDQYGYNYKAHIFNGSYANAYLGRPGPGFPPYTGNDAAYLTDNPSAVSHWTWQFRNVQLQMKWNDAWLSNKDCEGEDQGTHHSTSLDMHYGYDSFIGSGAWLTNHAKGTYESSEYNWDVSGDWVIAVNSGTYLHDYTFTMTSLPNGTFTGVGGYPAGAGSYTYDEVVINGQVSGDTISFTASYYISGVATGYSWNATGTIDSSGHFVLGTGTSGVSEWHSSSGVATKVYETCTVSDFVKIIAVPEDAELVKDFWMTADDEVIGPVIWGQFAIIQEKASDPCGEYEVTNYMSSSRKGLGGW